MAENAASERLRLDVWLVEAGHCRSRAQAQAAIKAGNVSIDGRIVKKASTQLMPGVEVGFAGPEHPYVSRGALKLLAALDDFSIDPSAKICLDLGASTGGFTQVLLERGARRVFAVDVGRDQLDPVLRNEDRVIVLEGLHARDLTDAHVIDPVSLIVCDVSFISIKKALPYAMPLTSPGAQAVVLVKPQFEVGPSKIGKGGLVSDDDGEAAALSIEEWANALPGWRVLNRIDSPVRGGDGNREFLMRLKRDD